MAASTVLRFTGIVLPDGERRTFDVVGGVIAPEPVADAEVVCTDGWIVPGLVDAHCHIGLDSGGAVDEATTEAQAIADRDSGALLLRDCGSAADTRWVHDREDLPRLVRAGRHLARPKRYIRNYGHEFEPEELPAYVAQEAQRGDGWVKLVGDWIDRDRGDLAPLWPRDVLEAAMEVAHAHGARVTAHVFGEEALPDLIEAGIDCIEHGTGLSPDLVGLMAERGVALVPTVKQLLNFPEYAASGEEKFPGYAAHMRDLFARRKETIGAAYDAGVAIYAGTDAGGVQPHGLLAEEVLELTAYGLSAQDALAAASWKGRAWLGFDAVLTPGAMADFVVYDADPLADLRVLQHPRTVVLRGRVVA
ncbi:amidohydrolase family protein [Nocardioides massiliensis]|uniref:Imidazolonepropionase-like amidohydrolase n=1 Tax=Nocardioides massiliensis TaxID=1325935 RepID=A0ABT9NRY4_9ACTN|nr:amidohydrolase family protein [Nocardioides massiliensis]MDP9822575.1 imidazolonepropionase-like amidohydrolase [Nocardioides massiliensis]